MTSTSSAASSGSAAVKRSLWDRVDDAINPIVVKELRQAVNSRFVIAVILILLLLQLVCVGIFLLTSGAQGQLDNVDFREGRSVFNWLQGILLFTCMLFLPLYTAVRLAAERGETNSDLLFITTIRPRSIITGKLFSAMVLAVMIFSACIPFMALTFYLRGIDWASILFILALDFLVIFAGVLLMVFLAVIPCHVVFKALLGLCGFGTLVAMYSLTMTGTSALLLWAGLTTLMGSSDFWLTCGAVLLGTLGVCGLFFSWSIAILSPPTSNRVLPIRVYCVVFWALSLAAAVTAVYISGEYEFMQVWLTLMAILCGLHIVIAINERRSWSPRVANTIPRGIFMRTIAFVFFSGAAGGILFAVLLAAATFGVYYAMPKALESFVAFRRPPSYDDRFVLGLLTLLLYSYAYSMSAVFLQQFLKRSITPVFTWLIALLLLVAGVVLPLIIAFVVHTNRWDYDTHWYYQLTSPIAAMYSMTSYRSSGYETQRDTFLSFAVGWSVLVTLACVPWFLRQMSAFRRPKEAPPTLSSPTYGTPRPVPVGAGAPTIAPTATPAPTHIEGKP